MALFGLFGKKDNNKDSENSESSYFLDQDAAPKGTFGK